MMTTSTAVEMDALLPAILDRAFKGELWPSAFQMNPEACAAKVEAAACPDLGKMGLGIVSFTIQSAGN